MRRAPEGPGRRRALAGALALGASAAALSCFQPSLGSGEIACGLGAACPAGLTCDLATNRCFSPGAAPDGGPPDAAPPDAAPPDGAPAGPPTSCAALLGADPASPSGVYTLDPDGPEGTGPAFEAFCEMAADGGGWTLLLKIDGNQPTLSYFSPLWTNEQLLNPEAPNLDLVEAKLAGFTSMPFQELRVGMLDPTDGQLRFLVAALEQPAASLQAAFSADTLLPTRAGVAAWRNLLASPSLQPSCNLEGLNVDPVPGNANFSRVRVGILGNNEADCSTPDSRIGLGGDGSNGVTLGCQSGANSAGDLTPVDPACLSDAGGRNTRVFGYVMIR